MKYPASNSCAISNRFTRNYRLCYDQALAIETFQSKWQMTGQEAHAFIARTRAQSEDLVRAELTAVQRFEDRLQRQYDGQLRSHVNGLQDECRDHVGQEEDKMRKELQHALAQESSVRQDHLQQALRHHACQEEYADAAAHQEMEQLKQLVAEQAEAMKRFESQSQQYVTSNMKSGLERITLSSSSLTVLSKTKMR